MQTLFIGQSLFFLHEVESTNTYANDLIKNVNPPEGAIVYTDNQTKGRGQRGTTWNSEIAQNITLSVVLKPHFLTINNHFYLSKITALALYDVLAELLTNSQYDIKIKWPNDILVNNKKIAGILIENSVQQHGIQNSIIGIGLNVNQTNFEGLEEVATSLKKLEIPINKAQSSLNKDFDRALVLEKICQQLEKWYLKLKSNHFDTIDKTYKKRLFKLNEIIPFTKTVSNEEFYASIIDVTIDGKLVLMSENGNSYNFELKEVKFGY